MGTRNCPQCGQFASTSHACPSPAATTTPATAPTAPSSAPSRDDLTERTSRAQAALHPSTPIYHQLNQLRRHALLPFVRPRNGLTPGDAADMAYDELRRYTGTFGGRNHPTWQEAWNTLTGATPDYPGVLRVKIDTCRTCNGRGYSTNGSALSRSLGRGLPPGTCPDCRGTRRNPEQFDLPAAYIPPPTPI